MNEFVNKGELWMYVFSCSHWTLFPTNTMVWYRKVLQYYCCQMSIAYLFQNILEIHFEHNKWLSRSCKLKEQRQCNGQIKMDEDNVRQNTTQKTKDWATQTVIKPEMNSVCFGSVSSSCSTKVTRPIILLRDISWHGNHVGHQYTEPPSLPI